MSDALLVLAGVIGAVLVVALLNRLIDDEERRK